MKKNTMYLVGGLAVLGLGYYLWNKKHEDTETANGTSESYSNATGKTSKGGAGGGIRCRRPDGTYYSQPNGATRCVYSTDTIVG